MTCPVYVWTVAQTGKVTFHLVSEKNTAMFIWSGCSLSIPTSIYLVFVAGGYVGQDAWAGVVRVHGPAPPGRGPHDARQQLRVQTEARNIIGHARL